MPVTRVTRRIDELRRFMAEQGGQMIVKPLDGKGGEGIFHLVEDDRNLTSILEQATAFGTRAIMAQQYLPAIREGDKRILLLEGEPIGAVLRVPVGRREPRQSPRRGQGREGAARRRGSGDHRPGRPLPEGSGPVLRRDRRDRRAS